jgi:hypothetical protein
VNAPEIIVAPDAPPVSRGVAARLKRSAAHPALARRMARMKGVLALRSSIDKQAATLRFDRGRIAVGGGVAQDAGLVITLNFDDPAVKPRVKGALRHPLLGLAAAKVLEPPVGSWRDEASAFWAFAQNAPRMPRSVLVVCTDDGSRLQLGEAGEPDYEVHGSAKELQAAFSGDSILLDAVLAGRLLVVGSLEHASVLTGRAIAWTLGEGR